MKWTVQFAVTVFITICVVVNNRTTRPREGACWPIHTMNLQYVAVINDSQIVGHTTSKFYSQITWYYITQRGSVICCQMSVILLEEQGRTRKGKGLVVPCRFNYYCEPTKDKALI